MNFIKASILEKDSKIILDAGFFQYELRRDLGEIVKRGASGSEVMIGFRPEHMLLSREKQANSVFQADVYVIEPMGSRIIVDLKAGDYLLKAVTPPTAEIPPPGQKVWVGFPAERLHVFDSKTEVTLI